MISLLQENAMNRTFKGLLLLSVLGFSSLTYAGSDKRVALMTFDMSRPDPRTDDKLVIYAHLETDYSSSDEVRTLVLGNLDNNSVELHHVTAGLWTLAIQSGQEAGVHTLHTDLYLEDVSDADGLRSEISTLNQQISALDSMIQAEEDPAQRAIYQADKDLKNTRRDAANNELGQTKTSLGSETFTFTVQ
jgi:hypothetical protein